jgi:SseB protein C-terminal domain
MDDSRLDRRIRGAVEVVGEQPDGTIERDFKRQLARVLQHNPAVVEAYLLRVRYDEESGSSVALCLQFVANEVDETVIAEVGTIFHATFGKDQHLDIIPLNERAAAELEFRPFYTARFASSG